MVMTGPTAIRYINGKNQKGFLLMNIPNKIFFWSLKVLMCSNLENCMMSPHLVIDTPHNSIINLRTLFEFF